MTAASPGRFALGTAALALPPAGLVVLLAAPSTDVHWEDHPAHFWLVLAAAVLSVVLAVATSDAAVRRRDARLLLVSLAYVAAAGFLGLHALATPGVLLDHPNAGFVVATVVGLLLASALLAASAWPGLEAERAAAVVARAGLLRAALASLLAVWAVASLAEVGPFDHAHPPESGAAVLVVPALVGVALYTAAAVGYARLWRRRPGPLPIAVAAGCVLLAEAMIAVAVARNWHASWWEWHVLMLTAVGLVAVAARRVGPEERFGDLYLDRTAAGLREVTVVFADLEGFTTWSEGRDPADVQRMLNDAFAAALPAVRAEGGEVDRLVGDAIVATFNGRGDQPDHALRGARAALAIVTGGGGTGAPRFRVGVNTGEVAVGLLGAPAGRTHTVVGDAVNVAARLQSAAPPSGVVVGATTLEELPGARATPLGELVVKGRRAPVAAHLLEGLDRPG
jgi:class 3 adenylate cyclase